MLIAKIFTGLSPEVDGAIGLHGWRLVENGSMSLGERKRRCSSTLGGHFKMREGLRVELPRCLVEVRLEEDDREGLIRRFNEEKVKEAIWECDDNKSPGPYGYNLDFYKECWAIVKEDFMRMLNEFYFNGKLVSGSNPSFIVLLPKKERNCGIG